MKWKCFLVFCILINTSCFAQESNIWGNIQRFINVKPYAGKKFSVQVAAKVIAIENTAKAGMYVSVVKENKTAGFYKNMADDPIIDKEWKLYELSGQLDKNAAFLTIGLGYSEKGIFYFDDFKLLVQNDAGIMEQVPLTNADFEEDSIQAKFSWWYNKAKNQYNISLTTQDFFSGKQCCKVDGSAIGLENNYGNNTAIGKYAVVNGIKIYYETYGKGQPLLLLHGNSSSIHLFEKQIPELAKKFKVIAVDTRGQGRSSEDGKTYTYDLFADDMNALLNDLHLDSVNILGWSDGGNTGLIMAMKYPAKVKRLVTMGAVVFIDSSVVDKWVFNSLNKEKNELIKNDASHDGKNRVRLIDLLLTEPKHNFEELKAIQCPVLVMAGEKDIVKENHTRSIAAHITKSKLLIVPKATHYFPSEDAPAFNKAVIDFFMQ